MQSSQAWQSTVGHEITHVLEGTDAYGALQSALFKYAESKGEYQSRYDKLTELYKGVKGYETDFETKLKKELTADLVGDYLFTDKAFINHLTSDRNLFQKVYDEIKYLWNVATGKEKTEIEKVKAAFDEAWKQLSTEGVKNATNETNISTEGMTETDISEATEYSDPAILYSIREEAPPKETGIAYKVFFVKDGKLYPPMVANPDGADTPMGVWLNADVGTAAPPSKTGRAQVKAGGKGTQGGSGSLAFRPGWHLGDLPRASQFDRVNPETGKKELFPENFVWAEVEYAKDVDYQEEAMSYGYTENGKFRHAYAGLPKLPENGYYRYRTNPKPDTVPWIITGAMKVNRLLSDAEVNAILEANGVAPVHRQGGDVGLDKFGFDENGTAQDVRFSISGENSKTADNSLLARATDMLDKGMGSEAVRQETGWYKGYDGKWRYEIDDSRFEFHPDGQFTNPDVLRYRELQKKFINGDITENEFKEMQSLTKALEGVKITPDTLGDVVSHKELFEAYPQLKNVKFTYNTLDKGTHGSYSPTNKAITINNSLIGDNEAIKNTLIHEIQHAIQDIEGFAQGASTEYWESQREDIVDTISGARENLNLWLDDIGYRDFAKKSIQEVRNNKKTIEQHWKDLEEFKANSKYAEQIAICEAELAEFQRQYDEITNGMTAYEQYRNTAGEIEARDAENRLNLTAEERRSKRPDIDNPNAIVLGATENGTSATWLSKKEVDYDPETATLKEQIVNAQDTLNKRNVVASANYGKQQFKNKADAKKWVQKTLAQWGGQVDRQNFGTIFFSKTDLDYAIEHINDPYQQTALGLLPYVLKRGDIIGEHDSHKMRGKHTITIGAPVEINGTRGNMGVVVNMNGKHAYSARVLLPDGSAFVFSDDIEKTSQGMHQGVLNNESLADTTSEVSDNSIAPLPENVNTKLSISPETDTEYMSAVERGDTETAQLMVDEAAKKTMPNSKVVDENGNLHLVYHGSPSKFTVFNHNKLNAHGNSHGRGFYFTEDRNLAEGYEKDGGQLLKGYLNIEKPLSEENITIKKSDLAKLIKATCESEAQILVNEGGYDSVQEAILDTWVSNYVDTYGTNINDVYREVANIIYSGNENDVDIIAEITNSGAGNEIVLKKTYEVLGYDGVIYTNETTGKHEYVALISNQFKSADAITYDDNGNVIPLSERFNTANEDIRYSLSNEGEEFTPIGNYSTPLNETALEDIAPVKEDADTAVSEDATIVEAPQTVDEKISAKLKNLQTELDNNKKLRDESNADFDTVIANLRAEYAAKKNKNTKVANELLRSIERMQRLKADRNAEYEARIASLSERVNKMNTPQYKRSEQRRAKQEQYSSEITKMIGDTSTWRDKKLGISYQTNTLHRNLRDVVRDANGNQDIAKADEIYEYLQGSYNRNEAALKRESQAIKQKYADMKINKHESEYIQMLGEFNHNPDTKLTLEAVDEYFENHKEHIDIDKVKKAIEMSRKDYDDLIKRVNAVLREQGMKEIAYKEGYFPHFTETKQGWLAKLFNWKTIDNEIPTDIAGLTEEFEPVRTYQSFDKHRKSDETDYNFLKGFDTYVHGALDWIYHIEDIQKNRAFENELRYSHSEQGIRDQIDEIRKRKDLDTDEAQALIDKVYENAKNPLNNFVTDLRNRTNNLAGKKSSTDRDMEYKTNRKVYSTMTNLSNRVSGNMVAGSISSALTNFIPITQSWGQVSPVSSLKAVGDVVRNTFRKDGMIEKSTFMTNRLIEEENLEQTGWDKASKVAGGLMNVFDHFTTEVVWRSKYIENINNGMSESEAISNADVFAENVMAGRSRGNMPTIYNSKNPITKIFTAFQLEVANQYGYMFKDLPQDVGKKNIGKLTSGYAKMFIGAYVYNALYSSLTGRDAAFDPIGILEDLMKDLGFGGDDEEETDVLGAVAGLGENIMQEIPYVGGMLGGGRMPISSAIPYDDPISAISGTAEDFGGVISAYNEADGTFWEKFGEAIKSQDMKNLTNEWLNPVYYLAMPFGGGQLKKTNEGLGMFSDEHPVAGSYTASGKLRFPVEDTPLNRLQAGIFGQYASENAREYFDNDYAPLAEKQIQEYKDVDIPIKDYWEYREGLKKQETLEDKFDYIAGLDLPVKKKNILINNIVDREDKVDMEGYEDFSGLEEFDFATKYPEKYALAKSVGGYSAYKTYANELYDIKADKDSTGKSITGSRKEKVLQYINNLNADFETKIILFKAEYPSDDTYNAEIINYLNNRTDLTYEDRVAILTELGFRVVNGQIYAD